jgi:cytochrome P450
MTVPRFAREDIVLGGASIKAGDALLVSFVSATRDLPLSGDADTLDVCRPDNRHLAFGHGVHFCLGAPLARLEGQVAIGALLGRCEGLALAVGPGALARRASLFTRGLAQLPVTFTPDAAGSP